MKAVNFSTQYTDRGIASNKLNQYTEIPNKINYIIIIIDTMVTKI